MDWEREMPGRELIDNHRKIGHKNRGIKLTFTAYKTWDGKNA